MRGLGTDNTEKFFFPVHRYRHGRQCAFVHPAYIAESQKTALFDPGDHKTHLIDMSV
ncbi:hypothetical protein SDC9_175604 [bioreactor metagenome]|uniref:Uncharacterized protein n=1 Tax=bioreactor metagenome TaxID=1076179 RepID=A0A645GN66_9ZZZZ